MKKNLLNNIAKDALAVLQGKIQCNDCYWYTTNTMKDKAFMIWIQKQLIEENILEVPKTHFGKCSERSIMDDGKRILYLNFIPPPKRPSPIKWRKCKWFISFATIMRQGGGAEAGLIRKPT